MTSIRNLTNCGIPAFCNGDRCIKPSSKPTALERTELSVRFRGYLCPVSLVVGLLQVVCRMVLQACRWGITLSTHQQA